MGRPSRYSPEVRERGPWAAFSPARVRSRDQFPLELGGTMRPSQILRKLAAYPRQNELAEPCGEVGRVERPLFTIDWNHGPRHAPARQGPD